MYNRRVFIATLGQKSTNTNENYRREYSATLFMGPCIQQSKLQCTLYPNKRSHYYFLNNSVKNEPILITFGILNPEGT